MTEYIRRGWQRMGLAQRVAFIAAIAAVSIGVLVTILPAAGPDSDDDGMSDTYENFFGLDPNDASDAAQNNDADTLDNLAESALWTDPFASDTDMDEWPDGVDDSHP